MEFDYQTLRDYSMIIGEIIAAGALIIYAANRIGKRAERLLETKAIAEELEEAKTERTKHPTLTKPSIAEKLAEVFARKSKESYYYNSIIRLSAQRLHEEKTRLGRPLTEEEKRIIVKETNSLYQSFAC